MNEQDLKEMQTSLTLITEKATTIERQPPRQRYANCAAIRRLAHDCMVRVVDALEDIDANGNGEIAEKKSP